MDQKKQISATRFGRLRRSALLRLLLKAYIRLIKIKAGTHEIALGFALGVLVAFSPTIGIQMPIAILVAMVFRASKLSAVLGVWVTNPFTAPFIYSFNYWLGAKLLGVQALKDLSREIGASSLTEIFHRAPEFLGAMTVGGVVAGIPLAIVGYFIAFKFVEEYQTHLKDKLRRQRARLYLRRMQRQLNKKAKITQDKHPSSTGDGPE